MGNLKWTDEMKGKLRELYFKGLATADLAAEFGTWFGQAVSYDVISRAICRFGFTAARIEENRELELYHQHLKLPMDDYLITLDYHSPYYSVEWHNRSLAVAEKFGITKLIIIGDLLDFWFASYYYSENKPKLEDEHDENARLLTSLLGTFKKIYYVKGNHEDRLGRATNGLMTAKWLIRLLGAEVMAKEAIVFSAYDKLEVGEEWLLVHPKSYSQISASTAVRLAEKYHKHVLNAHGHFLAKRYDRSGKFMGCDMGGMFDVDKIEYLNIKTTTHPMWNNGFGMLYHGHLYLFDQNTDWDFWLK